MLISLLISVISFAKLSAFVNSFSDIDGQKSFMSKIANLYLFLSRTLRNHSITPLVRAFSEMTPFMGVVVSISLSLVRAFA